MTFLSTSTAVVAVGIYFVALALFGLWYFYRRNRG